MTQSSSPIWREDEGQGPAPSAAAAPARDLFEQTEQSETLPGTRVELWRDDEGKPSVQARPEPAPLPALKSRTTSRPRDKRKLISWPLFGSTVVLVLLLALLADGGLALLSIRDRLEALADRFERVESELSAGRLDQAAGSVEDAVGEAEAAEAATSRPSLFIASLLPEADREIDALNGAVDAAVLAARAAGSVVEGATTLGFGEDRVPSALYSDGQVQLATVSESREQINVAEVALTDALVSLEQTDPRLEQLRAPIAAAHTRIGEALGRITDVRVLMDLLPPLFGSQGQRRYLLAFQALGEARATGGLIGFVGVLEAEDGRIELGDVGPGRDFFRPRFGGIDAPAWFEDSYAAQGALTQWQQTNVSPNQKAVSDVLLEMFERANGDRLDGVLMMDPIGMQELMAGLDPLEVQGRTIDQTNLAEIMLRESYTEFSTDEQNTFLTDVIDAFWERVSEGDVDLERFADGLGNAIRSQHFKMYSTRGGDERRIDALDLDGHYAAGPNSQMVFNINYGANKLDYFLQRDLETEIELTSGGDATVTTTARLENGAPGDGPPSPLLGGQEGLAPGVNRMTINLLMPPGSEVGPFSLGGEERVPFTYTDEGSPVVWDILEIPPGESETVTLTYTIPGAVQLLEGGTVFGFTLFPQATVNPDTYSLRIDPPPGATVVGVEGPLDEGPVPAATGRLEEPVSVRVLMEGD